ncbi:pilus assembly protein TadG-related protein [Pandoraea sp. B-6]|uniref:pilus assembly protein TadG-related protein n=1 Tax=Pandoraea sp. B-6 TaxID=1204340 RepID=UPI000A03649F|nr:pilus assembly protein TadG-related protein [Pandoraea sp. B-6]
MPAVFRLAAASRDRPSSRGSGQGGSVALLFLLFLIALLSFGAFAVDLARVSFVRSELQNAADAAALAGASALMNADSSGPNWPQARTAASNGVAMNGSDGQTLTTATVQTGYWNLSGGPAGIQPTTISPGIDDAPAVQVAVARTANQNGGAIDLLLGGLLNLLRTPGSAMAVAVTAPPGTVGTGGLFPVVLDQCIFDQYWNAKTNQPLTDPSTGQPYEFRITNGQTYGSACSAGQWTSFLINANNVPTIRTLIADGNPSPLSIGDNIWIEPGAKTTIYQSVPTNITVVMPVATQIDSKTYVPIVAFAAFYIDASVGGSGKYIQGHFVGGYKIPTSSSGVGPNYGAYVAPRLAQ